MSKKKPITEVVVTLSKPIKAHNDEMSSITITKPTGKDVRELGMPFVTNADGELVIKPGIVAKYIESIAGIPMSSIDQLEPADYLALCGAVSGFFQE